MHLPPYSPELNLIEQFWALVKRKLKRGRMLAEENLSSRIADAFQAGWNELLHRFDVGEGTILVLEFLNDASGRRVTAFDCIAGFAGSAVAIDV
ncbi:hypothetical protein G6F36_013086 [Rhizopus arrhizus]|nr:hypothetical protein G6F36_013086 [Rhizopus arrhizus]